MLPLQVHEPLNVQYAEAAPLVCQAAMRAVRSALAPLQGHVMASWTGTSGAVQADEDTTGTPYQVKFTLLVVYENSTVSLNNDCFMISRLDASLLGHMSFVLVYPAANGQNLYVQHIVL